MGNSNFIEVSVITPAYNSEKYIERCIISVLKQTNKNIEHIIIDDGSTDKTVAIIESYQRKFSSIKLIKNKINLGPINARNNGIEISTGRYIAFLDSDDYWLVNKIECQLKFMKDNKYALSYTDYRFVNHDSSKISRIVRGKNKLNIKNHLETRFSMGCLTVMIDKFLINSKFKFIENKTLVDRSEDFIAWYYLLEDVKFAYRIPVDLARYTIHRNSRSANWLHKANLLS